MTKTLLLQTGHLSIFEGDPYGFAVVGFEVHDASFEPVEVTCVRAFSTAMDFYDDDLGELGLVAVYAVPEISDLPGSERLILIASNGHLPEEWHNPLATEFFKGAPTRQ